MKRGTRDGTWHSRRRRARQQRDGTGNASKWEGAKGKRSGYCKEREELIYLQNKVSLAEGDSTGMW